MDRRVFWTAILVWLLISFVPALSAANLLSMFRGGKRGGIGK